MSLPKMVTDLWAKVPLTWRDHLTSALTTFVSDFLLSLGMSFAATGDLSWESGAIGAMLLTAVRAGVKASSKALASRLSAK